MNRRQFGKAGLAGVVGASLTQGAQAAGAVSYYELRTYELRNDLDVGATRTLFKENLLPVLKAQADGPIGCFNIVSGQDSPALVVLIPYSDLSKVQANTDLAASSAHQERWKAFESVDLPYIRMRSSVMKAFAGHPKIEVPEGIDGGHLFELRCYEAKNGVKSAAKIDMFNQEEIKIFRDCGMKLVFFGEGLFGDRLPHLTYMVAFKDMADRTQAWAKFGANPDWNRIKNDPRWLDTVSVIHASFLSSTDFSEIR
ncbi:MAG: NIPSNAP family protein [Acidobacteriota bacterium]|nr:MAG: NIPSNAP family protein [Acidobacteriota bacterium]